MRSFRELPEGYKEFYSVDLQKNKKIALFINLLAVVIALCMAVPMAFAVPISGLFSMEKGILVYMLRFASIAVLTVIYMVLHELVHGAAMKLCGTKNVKYGFTGMYAFAGSNDYYGRGAYIFIAIAPVVLWGIIVAIINPFVPYEWFWVVYFIQISNISGAAGDFYVTVKFLHFPKDILIRDKGVGMTVYSKNIKK